MLGIWLLSCLWIDEDDFGRRQDATPVGDQDADGVPTEQDCDDSDPDVGAAGDWYVDSDEDGFGDASKVIQTCDPDETLVQDNTDCDDSDGDAWPGAEEHCNGTDDDCDGAFDEGDLPEEELTLAWIDEDGDTYGVDGTEEALCLSDTAGYALQGGDCDDTDDAVWPGAPESCGLGDLDCSGDWAVCAPDGTIDEYPVTVFGTGVGGVGGVVAAGDFNGDGWLDLALGVPEMKSGDGGAVVLPGPLAEDVDLAVAKADQARAYTGDASSKTGNALAVGDLVGEDGLVDLVIAAGGNASSTEGAWVLSGTPLGGELNERALAVPLSIPELGDSAAAGDVDGDGIADLVLGSRVGSLNKEGGITLFQGPLQDPIQDGTGMGFSNFEMWGAALAIGDLDGDGYGDLAVGAPDLDDANGAGRVEVYVDIDFSTPGVFDPAGVFSGAPGQFAGETLAVLEPGNAIQYGWLMVGAPASEDSSGQDAEVGQVWAWQFEEGTESAQTVALMGPSGGARLGTAVCVPGDLDANGYTDLLLSLPGVQAQSGEVRYLGKARNLPRTADATFGGPSSGQVGSALWCTGDLTGDGGQDIAIGAPSADGGSGRVLIHTGTL